MGVRVRKPVASQAVIDLRVKREERAAAKQREEMIRVIRHAENVWRSEIERLRIENRMMRAALEQAHAALLELVGERSSDAS